MHLFLREKIKSAFGVFFLPFFFIIQLSLITFFLLSIIFLMGYLYSFNISFALFQFACLCVASFISCSELSVFCGFFSFIFLMLILWCSFAARVKTKVKPVSHGDLLCFAGHFSFMVLFVTNYHGL